MLMLTLVDMPISYFCPVVCLLFLYYCLSLLCPCYFCLDVRFSFMSWCLFFISVLMSVCQITSSGVVSKIDRSLQDHLHANSHNFCQCALSRHYTQRKNDTKAVPLGHHFGKCCLVWQKRTVPPDKRAPFFQNGAPGAAFSSEPCPLMISKGNLLNNSFFALSFASLASKPWF